MPLAMSLGDRSAAADEPVLALVSGGLDSLILVRVLLRGRGPVWPIYARFGLRWEEAELSRLRRWLARIRHPRLRPLAVLPVPIAGLYGRHWSVRGSRVPDARSDDAAVYLPGRNVLLLGCAAIHGARRGITRLALGTLKGNPFGDATPAFFRRFSGALGLALGRPVRIEAPLRRDAKAPLIRRFPDEPYALTFSCLRPVRSRHCGRCNKCAERRRAFRLADLADPTRYETRAAR